MPKETVTTDRKAIVDKPTHLKQNEQAVANREGWGVYHPDGYVGGRAELQSYDLLGVDLGDDNAAIAFVRSQASRGSKLHRKALAIVE